MRMWSLGVLQNQFLSAAVSAWRHMAADVQLQSRRSVSFASILKAGRGNDPFLSANPRQGNKGAVLIAQKMNHLPSSFITLFYFFFRGREKF